MIRLRAILGRYLGWMGFLGIVVVVACGGSRTVAKKRRKVRMPCPCNLSPRFPVYLAYASHKERERITGAERDYGPYYDSGRVCRWTDR